MIRCRITNQSLDAIRSTIGPTCVRTRLAQWANGSNLITGGAAAGLCAPFLCGGWEWRSSSFFTLQPRPRWKNTEAAFLRDGCYFIIASRSHPRNLCPAIHKRGHAARTQSQSVGVMQIDTLGHRLAVATLCWFAAVYQPTYFISYYPLQDTAGEFSVFASPGAQSPSLRSCVAVLF